MPIGRPLALLLTLCASASFAAPANYLTVDHSSATLVESKRVPELWKASQSAKLIRLYPVAKWGFATQVEGGFDDAKVCVITARAMMLPRRGAVLVFQPAKTTTTFGSQAGATAEQCKALAQAKLRESIEAMIAALLQR